MKIKLAIASAIVLLTELNQNGHVRDEGNVKFQAAMAELEAANAEPEPEAVKVESPDLVALNGHLVNVTQRLIQVEAAVAQVVAKHPDPAPATAAAPAPAA